jgi:hypothetical protein
MRASHFGQRRFVSRLELRDRGLDRTLDGAIVGVLQLAPLAIVRWWWPRG